MSIVYFRSHQIRGHGVGGKNVVSTINLSIPSSFDLPYGVYAGKVSLGYTQEVIKRAVALHFGPRPTAKDFSPSLELHVLDVQNLNTDYNAEDIGVEIVQYIREVKKFENFTQLRDQIQRDIVHIREILG